MKISAVTKYKTQPKLQDDIQTKTPSETRWEIDLETVVAVFAFIIALIFILFMGFGWLNGKATAAQFIQVGTTVTSGFTGIIIGIVEAKKKEQGSPKNKTLMFAQFFFIALAFAIGGYALFRTF